jgi:hypothetical protein
VTGQQVPILKTIDISGCGARPYWTAIHFLIGFPNSGDDAGLIPPTDRVGNTALSNLGALPTDVKGGHGRFDADCFRCHNRCQKSVGFNLSVLTGEPARAKDPLEVVFFALAKVKLSYQPSRHLDPSSTRGVGQE